MSKKYKVARFNLDRALKKFQLTKYRLSKNLGEETHVITRWSKSGHNPTLRTLNRIAEAIGNRCTIFDLIEV